MQAEGPPAETEFTAYLAADGFLDELLVELGAVDAVHGRLVLASGAPRPATWAQNIWYAPQRLANGHHPVVFLRPNHIIQRQICSDIELLSRFRTTC